MSVFWSLFISVHFSSTVFGLFASHNTCLVEFCGFVYWRVTWHN